MHRDGGSNSAALYIPIIVLEHKIINKFISAGYNTIALCVLSDFFNIYILRTVGNYAIIQTAYYERAV